MPCKNKTLFCLNDNGQVISRHRYANSGRTIKSCRSLFRLPNRSMCGKSCRSFPIFHRLDFIEFHRCSWRARSVSWSNTSKSGHILCMSCARLRQFSVLPHGRNIKLNNESNTRNLVLFLFYLVLTCFSTSAIFQAVFAFVVHFGRLWRKPFKLVLSFQSLPRRTNCAPCQSVNKTFPLKILLNEYTKLNTWLTSVFLI